MVVVACTGEVAAPANQSAWQREPGMEVARSENPAVVLDNTIYTMGGLVSNPQGTGATD